MAYHTTANGEIYVEQNGIDVLLFPDTAAAILNDKTARIAELEQALRELKKENELLRADCVSFAKFLNSGQLISRYIDKLIAKYIGE